MSKEIKEQQETALVTYNKIGNALTISNKAVNVIAALHQTDDDGNPVMSDESVKNLFGSVIETERAAFVLRGAAAYELVERANKEFSKLPGDGVNAVLRAICSETGVSVSTLQEDHRIYSTFRDELVELLAENPEALMDREFYRLACQGKALYPPATDILNFFRDQKSAVNYTTANARRDIRLLNGGQSFEQIRKADVEVREAQIAAGGPGKAKATEVRERTLPLHVVVSDNMEFIIASVQKKYGSMSDWILRRGIEEFGEAPKTAAAPAPAPKAKAKEPAPKAKAKDKPKTDGKANKQKAKKATTVVTNPDGDTGAA